MKVARELFPLPAFAACSEACARDTERARVCSRSVQRRLHARDNWRSWADSAVNSMNEVFGAGEHCSTLRPSAAQLAAVDRIGRQVRSMGKPCCTPTEALSALCGAHAGLQLYGEAVPRATYRRGCISLPEMGGVVDGADVLEGHARELWCEWRKHILRQEPLVDDSVPAKPFSDPALVCDRLEYALFVSELVDRGLAKVGEFGAATVGVFFVAKKAEGNKPSKLRLILDTRCVNKSPNFLRTKSWPLGQHLVQRKLGDLLMPRWFVYHNNF